MCGGRWKQDRLLRTDKPTVLHRTLESAYTEAARMADAHKMGDYAIFECIGRCLSPRKKKPKVVNELGALAET